MVVKASSAAYSIFWVFADGDEPCKCCSAFGAMEEGEWYCTSQNRSWAIVDEPIDTWGDLVERDFAEAEERMTNAQKAERQAKEEASAAERGLSLEASRMFNYAESQKLLNSRGKGKERRIGKVDEPCKFLYCDEHAPKSQWTTNAKGERCAPLRKSLTGSECWAHEYRHPKTKALMKPHTCKRLHPNEDGWRVEWNMNRTFRVAPPSAADGFFAQRMAVEPVPQPAPQRFAFTQKVDNSAW